MPSYELKSLKSTRGHDGCSAWTASLYKDGVRVAAVGDSSYGGPLSLSWLGGAVERDAFAAFLAGLPRVPCSWGLPGATLAQDEDLYLGLQAEAIMLGQQVARAARKSTVFRMVGDARGVIRKLSGPLGAEAHAYLKAQYGEALAEVYVPGEGFRAV